MTVQPTRDQLLDMTERLGFLGDRPDLCDEVVNGLWAALNQQEAELDSWMARAYEAEKRACQAEKRLAGWMEHWNATARTGAVDEVAAILEANTRADQAEARIKAVRDVLDQARDEFEQPDEADIRRALESVPPPGQ
ncbi:hypothetical protein ACIGH6_14320 [Brachybacterium paraconglomeratum]|uniref:hypothetical protein n=1 Tax=Brachybacterium paraconglomeratum TaxID=173362 RepID=UPI0037CC47CD